MISWVSVPASCLAADYVLVLIDSSLHAQPAACPLVSGSLKTFFNVSESGAAHTALADTRVLASLFPPLLELCGASSIVSVMEAGVAAGLLQACKCHLATREQQRSQVRGQ